MSTRKYDLSTCEGRGAYFQDTLDVKGFIDACDRAFRETPDDPSCASQYAAALHHEETDEALSILRNLLSRFPKILEIRLALGLALLKRGRYREAWRYYGGRFGLEHVADKDIGLAPETRWKGESLEGRSILLYHEQGLGDTVQFIRHAMNLRDLGARVYIDAQPALRRLFEGSPALGGGILSGGTSVTLHSWSYTLDLIPVFCETDADVSWRGSYIEPPARREALALPARGSRPIRVGLAWEGSRTRSSNHHRLIPLQAFRPLREISNCSFYSLMPPSVAGDIAALGAEGWLTDLSAISSPFDELARVIDAMDIVVTVCTSIAHLAGAMGKPVLILLSARSDWRWGHGGSETRWYPSATLIRQKRLGDWTGPIDETRRILSQL